MQKTFDPNSDWRLVAAALYRKPTDSKIFGSVEIDITELEDFIQTKRKEGLKITLTHVMALTVARALRESVPEMNCYVRRGRIVHRKEVNAHISVLRTDAEGMTNASIHRADEMDLASMVKALQDQINEIRRNKRDKQEQLKSRIAAIPWPFRHWLLRLIRVVSIDWGLSLPGLGIRPDTFGSFILSNIGSLGLEMGYPALMPASNLAFVLIMGGVQEKPWVHKGQIMPRRILSLGIAMDHRVVDASHGGKLFSYIKSTFARPEILETPPRWSEFTIGRENFTAN